AQWDKNRQKGLPPITGDYLTDLNNQLDYIIKELNTTEKKAGNLFKATTNLSGATSVFANEYERMGAHEFGDRHKFAGQALQSFRTAPAGIGPGTIVGKTGNTGRSTGPHLDIRAKNAKGERVNPEQFVSLFKAGGKPLSSYPVTSGYGYRTSPYPGFHHGIDYGIPSGTELEFTGQAKSIRKFFDPNGGGFVTEITLLTGEVISLLHLLEQKAGTIETQVKKPAPPVQAVSSVKTEMVSNVTNPSSPVNPRATLGGVTQAIPGTPNLEGERQAIPDTQNLDYRGILTNLKDSKKISIEVMANLVAELDQNNLEEIKKTLESLNIDIYKEQGALNEIKKAKLIQEEKTNQLKIEQAIVEQGLRIEDTITRQKETLSNMNIEMINLGREAKGYLTYQEEIADEGEKINQRYIQFGRTLSQTQKELEKLTNESSDLAQFTEQAMAAIEAGSLSESTSAKLKELIGAATEGEITLQQLLDEVKQYSTQLPSLLENALKQGLERKGIEIKIKVDLDLANAYKQLISLGGNVLSVPVSLDFQMKAGLLELESQFTQMEQDLKTNIGKAGDNQELVKQYQDILSLLPEIKKQSIDAFQRDKEVEVTTASLTKYSGVMSQLADMNEKMNPWGGGAKERILADTAQINAQALELVNTLAQLKDQGIVSSEQFDEASNTIETFRTEQLQGLGHEYSKLKEFVEDPLAQAMSASVNGLIKGTTSMKEILVNFLDSVAGSLAQFAAKLLANNVLKTIMGIFGKGLGMAAGGLAGGQPFSLGGLFGGTSQALTGTMGVSGVSAESFTSAGSYAIGNYADGGEIFDVGGYFNPEGVGFKGSAFIKTPGQTTNDNKPMRPAALLYGMSPKGSSYANNLTALQQTIGVQKSSAMAASKGLNSADERRRESYMRKVIRATETVQEKKQVMSLGIGVMKAMKREGQGAVPIVAKRGEHVLSTKNQDAQTYRKLVSSGAWSKIKNNYSDYNVGNSENGGQFTDLSS
ncbi:MAG: phage tail tip lysozyme, partial [Crocosphaera sp.]